MNQLYRTARRIKNSSPLLRWLYSKFQHHASKPDVHGGDYEAKLSAEQRIYKDVIDINDLPPIFHYWSNTHLRPMLEEFGFSNPDQFFAKFLHEAAGNTNAENPIFLSVGAGNCDTEVRVAKLLLESGLTGFVIECLDMNPYMLERGRELAVREGVSDNIAFVEGDFNKWSSPRRKYTAVMANQSLHHVLDLEHLFDEISKGLRSRGYFITSDMIGRNGHQRWPEALAHVHRFWRELPDSYRYNRQLDRHEELYQNWDCSVEGFEGIRAQDILKLLVERYDFRLFIGFGNVIDVFIDRGFGHNFDATQEWDRDFIDRVHQFDEDAIRAGSITPTHIMAVMTVEEAAKHEYSRNLLPKNCIRTP